jgi:putative ABC transport system substrate-binding protein
MAEELIAKRLELLKEVLPGLSRVALLGNVSVPIQAEYEKRAQAAASQLKMRAALYAVTSRAQLSDAFKQMQRDGLQAVMLLPDAWFYPSRNEIVALAAEHRIAAMYGNTDYAVAGGLLVYAPDLPAMSERAAGYVVRILKGAKAAELPVEGPTKLQFIVNQRVARELGISISPSVLLRATKVIE